MADMKTSVDDPHPQDVELERARAAMDSVMMQNRPKNLQQGLCGGVGTIIEGAVGAAGIAVLTTTVGMNEGSKRGGVVGGIFGVVGGALIGGTSAAALAVGGTVSGVAQMVRGVAAVPQQIAAPRQGKWWSESENKWIYTDLHAEATKLEDIPSDDRDILRKLQEELDQSAAASTTNTAKSQDVVGDSTVVPSVKDMYYYDIMGIDANAESPAIKRRFYLLARQYHPDKMSHNDDENKAESTNTFKQIVEAYQILSDPELRAQYDKLGRDGVISDALVANPWTHADLSLLHAFLFGSDRFDEFVGRLATATSASVGDSQAISLEDAKTLQRRRCTRLALKLVERIDPWVASETDEQYWACRNQWLKLAMDLSTASFGLQLVRTIGKVYCLTATQFLGSLESRVGLPSIEKWAMNQHARIAQARGKSQQVHDTHVAKIDMASLPLKYKEKMSSAESDEEKAAVEKEWQQETYKAMMQLLWTTAVVDITSTVHETANRVFFDQYVDKAIRKKRANAVKALGEAFELCPAPPAEEEEGCLKDARLLYEEAALLAMVETMKRKDGSAQEASAGGESTE